MTNSPFPPIPKETAKAANAFFGRSNFYIETGRRADDLLAGVDLRRAQGWLQKSRHTVAMLYLVTIFQFRETLPDEQAADALQERLDWKHALHLPLQEPGLEASLLCDFRKWLLVDAAGMEGLGTICSRAGVAESVEGEKLVNRVCLISRVNKIWGALRDVLEILALQRPDWLRGNILPTWYMRYGDHNQGPDLTADRAQLQDLAQKIGADGFYLIDRIARSGLVGLLELPQVQVLKQVWEDQFERRGGEAVWREDFCAGCSLANVQNLLRRKT